MVLRYIYHKRVPLFTWQEHDKNNTLAKFVEDIGWEAIGESRKEGYTKKVKDVSIDVVPNFQEEKTYEMVRVTLLYESVL